MLQVDAVGYKEYIEGLTVEITPKEVSTLFTAQA